MDVLPSFFFVEAPEKAGVVEQEANESTMWLKKHSLVRRKYWRWNLVMPSEDYQVTAMVDFGTKVLGNSECDEEYFWV
jgi:UDP-3-O-[3-hydroxymyristoyl] N-acetylglucosamine deacetylase/3-hydroxyacyl-[acyl-carrier-protein] dehydratase